MSPPDPSRRTRRAWLAPSGALLALLLAGCSDGAEAGSASTTTSTAPPAEVAETTTSTTTPSTTTSSTTTSTSTTTTTTTTPPPTLPLVPTTSTTLVDRSTDPPAPVADPGGEPGRNSVFVVGDSVFLGTASSIPIALPDWVVTYDASGNRRLAQAVDLIAARRPVVGEAVVIHLGNNFIDGERGTYGTQIDEVMTTLSDVPRVVWVTVAEVSPSRQQINVEIRAAAERWPNLRVADWAPIVAGHPEWTFDGVHLTFTGRREMAALIAATLGPVDEPAG